MKKLLSVFLLLLFAVAFISCKKDDTTVVVKNTSDFQISDMILFCYQGNDQVDQKSAGSLGVGATSSPIVVSDKVEKVAVSFKFFFEGSYSVRYITVNKYLLTKNAETVITISNDTMITYYSDSKSSPESAIESVSIESIFSAE
jgi:hypothetical protein